MPKYLSLKLSAYICMVGTFICISVSCTKIPGHTLKTASTVSTGTTVGCVLATGAPPSTNGIGNIAVGGINTIIFQVNNGTTYTISQPTYTFVTTFLATGSNTSGPFTVITALNPTNGDNVNFNYDGLIKGNYDAELLSIVTQNVSLSSSVAYGGTEKFNIITQTVNGATTGIGSFSGLVSGTFDGYMLNGCGNKVRVAGSLNISK